MTELERSFLSNFQVDRLAHSAGNPIARGTLNGAYARIVIPRDTVGSCINWHMQVVTAVKAFNPELVWIQLVPRYLTDTFVLHNEHSQPYAIFDRLSPAEDVEKITSRELDWSLVLSPRISAEDLRALRPNRDPEHDALMGTFDRVMLDAILAPIWPEHSLEMEGNFRINESKFRSLVRPG